MKTTRIALATLALAAALTSCSGTNAATPDAPPATDGSPAPAAPPQDGPSVATTDDEAAAESTFLRYYQALVARDFATACGLSAPETRTTLVNSINTGGGKVGTCEEAFTAVYAIPGAGERADRIASSTKVEDVTVDGDNASVNWSAEAAGERRTVASRMHRVEGDWLLLGATS